jgi:hypothetical protein
MKKEALERAKEIEQQIGTYDKIAYAVSFPWQKFKLFGRQAYVGSAGYNTNIEITLSDPELAKLIEDYCRAKVKKLKQELEEL